MVNNLKSLKNVAMVIIFLKYELNLFKENVVVFDQYHAELRVFVCLYVSLYSEELMFVNILVNCCVEYLHFNMLICFQADHPLLPQVLYYHTITNCMSC